MNQNTHIGHISWSPDYDSSKPKARPVDVPRLVRPLSGAESLAGRLLAFIKVNHQRGTFADCTDEQLAEHLQPFEDELKSIKANAEPTDRRESR
jgi:hypothetical protein